jgi:hypothetical protein
MENNPQVVFEKLFGDGGNDADRAARRRQSRSLLDSVLGQVASLRNELPAGDRVRLAEYLDNVREIERRIQKAERQVTSDLKVPPAPVGIPADFERHIKLMFDLQVLAWQADITRVSTLLLAKELSGALKNIAAINTMRYTISVRGLRANIMPPVLFATRILPLNVVLFTGELLLR